jgi:hypothetical protein
MFNPYVRWLATPVVGAVLMALVIAGCGGSSGGQGTTSTTATTAPTPPGRLVDFRQSGGVAGLLNHLVVQDDGSARLETGPDARPTTFRLSQADLRRVRQALEAAHIETLKSDYSNDPPIPDDFGYGITYKGRTVSTADTRAPRQLRDALSVLSEIARRHG